MSDDLRKDFSKKIDESLTPQDQKSTSQKVKEDVTDKADKVASKAQPEDKKSTLQKLSDSYQAGVDDAKTSSEKHPTANSIGGYINSAKQYVSETIDSFNSGKSGDATGSTASNTTTTK